MGHPQAFDLETLWPFAGNRKSELEARPRARLVITSPYGAIELDVDDVGFAGVLFVAPGPIAVGDTLELKVQFSDPQELRVEVTAIDGDATPGRRHPIVLGLEVEVEVEVEVEMRDDDEPSGVLEC